MYNLSFDQSRHRIIQAHRRQLLDDHTSPTHIEERVIVSDVRRHLAAMAEDSQAYTEATSSIVKFLIT